MDIAAAIAFGVLLVAASALGGLGLGRYAWPATRRRDVAALVAGQIEATRLMEECRALRSRVDELQTAHKGAAIEAQAAAVEVARLGERERALSEMITAQAAQRADLHTQLATEFENIANRILKANASELSESSQRAVAAMLEPLRERLHDFQSKVETTYASEAREILSLKEQIKLIVETSHAIGTQADGLAKALRGDSQLLGRWGELALERILEAAGLTEGREYIAQGRGLGLRNEAGGVQKPDIIIVLPEQRTMIIDSKVPLTGYERLIASREEAERAAAADRFLRDVKAHIDSLAGKRYQDNGKLLAHERELFTYAWDRRVVLVGPSTLLMTMRTVASIWRYELQGQNAQEIARFAGELCDKVAMSLSDLNGVAEKITAALNAHNDAVKRLSTGRGNALSIGTRIRSLGVKSKRPMPAMLADGGMIAAAVEEFAGAPPLEDLEINERPPA